MALPNNPKSILVRAPNWIGDQIIAYPFFYFLRRAYPRAKIVSVCVDWVKDLQFHSLVDDVFVLPRAKEEGMLNRFKAVDEGAKKLQEMGPWDMGIALPNSLSAAWLLFRSGARERRGYSVEGRGILLTERVHWDPNPGRHRAQAYADLLPHIARPDFPVRRFWGLPPENDLEPATPGVIEKFDAEREWPHAKPLSGPKEPYWVMLPGSQAESRRWPVGSFAELARKITQATGWTGVVIGGKKEAPLAAELCGDPSLKLIDMTDRGAVPDLWKLFREAKFAVACDSGLAHVAALCGTPVQVIFGAGDPRRTRPIGPGPVQVKVNPVDCWPCEKNICFQPPSGFIKCLRGISPETIWEEIRVGFGL